ncbi:hypothetical protein BKA70DRAFT_1268139 [Coprinopsis sp. MPI-PUGE-AT-0042]|nr:hypothetical protein BKA70DRAFT_1268139 [Coprinopsis sp. MPI-PUGE-AT-0042]
MHIELPQLANPSLGLNNTMGSQPYMTPSSSISSPPAQPIASEMAKETAVVSVATTFYPGNPDVFPAPDTILSSDDGTLFYLNSQLLAGVGFKVPSSTPLPGIPLDNVTPLPQSPFLPTGSVAKLPDSSITLSIIFHSLYNLSSASLSPALPALSHAISRMSEYSLTPCGIIQPGTALYVDLMTQHAPLQALQLYALAGKHGIEPLAVDVSSHLLGLNLSEITDEVATAMGSVYLKRLFFMHKGRVERLKSVLAKPPLLHADKVADCDSDKQGALRRKWALLVTSLAWDARPDISPHAIKQHLRITGDSIPCKSCRSGWMERVGEASTEWATVKFTI